MVVRKLLFDEGAVLTQALKSIQLLTRFSFKPLIDGSFVLSRFVCLDTQCFLGISVDGVAINIVVAWNQKNALALDVACRRQLIKELLGIAILLRQRGFAYFSKRDVTCAENQIRFWEITTFELFGQKFEQCVARRICSPLGLGSEVNIGEMKPSEFFCHCAALVCCYLMLLDEGTPSWASPCWRTRQCKKCTWRQK